MRYPDSKNPNSVQEGLEFQDKVMDRLAEAGMLLQNYTSKKYQFEKGENRQGWEIKLDNRCTETGRLSIETYEKTAKDRAWVRSGVLRDDNGWIYVQGNNECFWVFLKKFLRSLYDCTQNGVLRYKRKEELTIKAFYLPLEDADKYGQHFNLEDNGDNA